MIGSDFFGSLTGPECFGPDSDVDMAIRGLGKFDHCALVGDLSILPGCAVDVVRLEGCPFARRIVENPDHGQKEKSP